MRLLDIAAVLGNWEAGRSHFGRAHIIPKGPATVLDGVVTGSRAVMVKGVTRRFGSTWVLKGVDARFDAGSLTVVYGANGAGKSTLLGIVGGLIQPSAGTVTWEPSGERVEERREGIGWVGHDSSSYRELTVTENVAFVAAVHGMGSNAARECIARVGAEAFADRRVGTLSRGQKQRVALARGIVSAPEMLLLDEPFTGLDSVGSAALEAILLNERDRGAIVIVVSHDEDLARRLDGEALWLLRGRASTAPTFSHGK